MAPPAARILVVDDLPFELEATAELLRDEGYRVEAEGDARRALGRLAELEPDVVVTDLQMPGASGLDVLKAVRGWREETPVIVMTGHGGVREAVDAMRQGAFDFISKGPELPDALSFGVKRAVEMRRMRAELAALRGRLGFDRMVGRSKAMQEVYDLLQAVAGHDASVLVLGENGTGKELVARAVHQASPRARGPFVAVNCSALTESLLESELFGHARGAFTGAVREREGCFERADGGTIFLDEIGDMPLTAQPRLLRVLQEREVVRVGETDPRKVNVRVVAATNRDLKKRVAEGAFREDLYFRLRVVTVRLPPLRERREDVPLLAEHFLREHAQKAGRTEKALGPGALSVLGEYGWPGNVRELAHAMEHAFIVGRGDSVEARDLPPEILEATEAGLDATLPVRGGRSASADGAGAGAGGAAEGSAAGAGLAGIDSLRELERLTVTRVLTEAGWNIHEAARRLEISRPTLYSKIEKLGLQKPA